MVLRLREGHCRVSNLDDPAIVAEIKQAAETMRKAMVQLNELNSGLAAETSGQSLNQMMMMRWVILTKEEIAKKIINLVAVNCLCHKVKREAFACDEDYFAALHSHHAVMQAAMNAKQSANTAAADALDYAIEDFAKMYIKE
jgi:nickel superoxide dismutase